MDETLSEKLFAASGPGLEPVLLAEARALGVNAEAVPGGVELSGPRGTCYRANLWLRTAQRILFRLGTAPSGRPEQLERALAVLPWRRFLPPGAPVRLSVAGDGGRQLDLARVLRAALGVDVTRAGAEDEAANGVPHLFLRESRGAWTVSLDSSGTLLHKRGYRQEVSRAPLRESLAAGLLGLAGYRPDEPFWDPMCGSGTLVIEAALLARNIAPGVQRAFAFQAWPSFDAPLWTRLLDDAEAAARPRAPAAVRGSDLHAGSLGTARRNARRAGVFEDLTLERLDATALTAPSSGSAGPGLILSNLPYGGRVGERAELGALYQGFGKALRQAVPGWRAALYVQDADLLERSMGLKPTSRTPVPNGGIRCELCCFTLPPARGA